MYSAASHQLTECADCTAFIAPRLDRSFNYAAGAYFCYGCAVARGGVYDFQRECWAILPDVETEPETDPRSGTGSSW